MGLTLRLALAAAVATALAFGAIKLTPAATEYGAAAAVMLCDSASERLLGASAISRRNACSFDSLGGGQFRVRLGHVSSLGSEVKQRLVICDVDLSGAAPRIASMAVDGEPVAPAEFRPRASIWLFAR